MITREVKNTDLVDLAKKISETAECDCIIVLNVLQNWFYRSEK